MGGARRLVINPVAVSVTIWATGKLLITAVYLCGDFNASSIWVPFTKPSAAPERRIWWWIWNQSSKSNQEAHPRLRIPMCGFPFDLLFLMNNIQRLLFILSLSRSHGGQRSISQKRGLDQRGPQRTQSRPSAGWCSGAPWVHRRPGSCPGRSSTWGVCICSILRVRNPHRGRKALRKGDTSLAQKLGVLREASQTRTGLECFLWEGGGSSSSLAWSDVFCLLLSLQRPAILRAK